MKTEKNPSKMATENEYVNNLFKEIEMWNEDENNNENNNDKLPIAVFQFINAELCDVVLNNEGSESDDETDGPIQFIQNIAENVKEILRVL